MRRRSGIARGLWLAVLVAGALDPGSALAANTDRGTAYEAASGCPDRTEWTRALHARLPERLRAEAERRHFTVRIEQGATNDGTDPHYVGELGSENTPSGEARRVTGASCRDVRDALTLIAALEVQRSDPNANDSAARSVPSDSGDPGADSGPVVRAPSARDALRINALAFALFQAITAPKPSADLGAGVALSWQTDHWQPWVLLGMYFGGDDVRIAGSSASAHFERWATYVVGCPLRFPQQSPAGVRPCLDLDLGRLTGQGHDVALANDSSSLLASAGAQLRFEWSVLEQLALGAQLGGVLSLSRQRFFFAPEFTALQVPAAGLRAGASASLAFRMDRSGPARDIHVIRHGDGLELPPSGSAGSRRGAALGR